MQDHLTNIPPVLVEVRRGSITESQHRGTIVAVDPLGNEAAVYGNPEVITSSRSTIKPLQALPFITSGAADHFSCSARELATICASHQGESIHTEAVASLLERAGLNESALRCGTQPPYSAEALQELENAGIPYNQLHNNCSGNHAAMVLTALHEGLATDDYYKPEHPVQQAIVSVLRMMGDVHEEPPVAIDGCSAPTFAISLRSLALSFARLTNPRLGPEEKIESACRRVVAAMIDNPEYVGATKGRFDTDLLRAANGKLICKVGAEAVYGIGILPCGRFPRGLGIAIKIEDGSYRGLSPAVVETLAQLKLLEAAELETLESYRRPLVDNRRGLIVGEVTPVFKLDLV